jgi:DcmR-like sensory protein
MSTLAPVRARQSYRHEAFLWRGHDDFVQQLVPFVRDGIEAGEAVMVAVTPEHIAWIRNELGPSAAQVHFVDMTELGRNPARIIPAWQQFLDEWSGDGRPARGIGEPIWVGRRPEEVVECQLHEALLNLAVDPELPFWLVCPYDAEHLGEDVLAEAGRSHPAIATSGSYQGSPGYRGHSHAEAMFSATLPPVGGRLTGTATSWSDAVAAADHVILQAAAADLWSHKVVALAEAVRELAGDSLSRGAAEAVVRLWDEPDVVVCEVADTTVTGNLLAGRQAPLPPGQDALWQANQLCDLVQVRSDDHGTTVRLHMWK